jgi:ABC-type phosphate transport system substrate-binding protein
VDLIMKLSFRRAGVIGLAVAATMAVLSSTAGAVPVPGSDDNIDVARGAGSDTTYTVHQGLDTLYNQSPGCTLFAGSPVQDQYQTCAASQPAGTIDTGNYDHDLLASDFPVGSSAGIRMLASASPGHPVAYARSSRDHQASDAPGLTFTAIAKDGIAVVNLGNRPPVNLTLAQLQGIFVTCTINQWGQINGNPADTTPIRPYGVQTSSGTYLSFQNKLGADPNTCANAIGTGRVLFENDTLPIETAADRNNAIWWMSFAAYNSVPSLRGTAVANAFEGLTPQNGNIFNSTYGITRYVYMVTRNADEAATGGVAGAAIAYRNWLCRLSPGHTTNRETGNNFGTDITNTLNGRGFQRLNPALGETSAGQRCQTQVF